MKIHPRSIAMKLISIHFKSQLVSYGVVANIIVTEDANKRVGVLAEK